MEDAKVIGKKFSLRCFIFGHKVRKRHVVNYRGAGVFPSHHPYGVPEISVYAECERCGASTLLYRAECRFECCDLLNNKKRGE